MFLLGWLLKGWLYQPSRIRAEQRRVNRSRHALSDAVCLDLVHREHPVLHEGHKVIFVALPCDDLPQAFRHLEIAGLFRVDEDRVPDVQGRRAGLRII